MTRILYPEFREQFDGTKYPFAARSTLVNATGQVIAPTAFLDAQLYPVGGQARMYLSQIVVGFNTLTFTIGDEAQPNRASGVYALQAPQDNVILTDSYGRPAGILISEQVRLAAFQAWGLGTYPFLLDQTEFAATCCTPTPEVGVRAILLEDGSMLSGQVWIVGADGVVVRQESVVLPAKCGEVATVVDVIRVDIIGDPLFRRRLCENVDLFETPRPIRQIRVVNGAYTFITSPVAGGLTIQSNDGLTAAPALRIRPAAEGLVFEALGSVQAAETQQSGAVVLPPDYVR